MTYCDHLLLLLWFTSSSYFLVAKVYWLVTTSLYFEIGFGGKDVFVTLICKEDLMTIIRQMKADNLHGRKFGLGALARTSLEGCSLSYSVESMYKS